MKRTIISLLLAFVATASYAEKENDEKSKEMLEFKTTYIVERMNLTKEESEKFIPIYERYTLEKFNSSTESPFNDFDSKANDDLSEEEYRKINDDFVNGRINRALSTKVYYERFREIIPESKIYKMQMAERDFKHELLRRVHNKSHQREHGRTTTTNKK